MAVADDFSVINLCRLVKRQCWQCSTLAKAGHTAQVNWFHAAENGDVHACDEVKELGSHCRAFTAHTWYRQPSEAVALRSV